MFGNVDRDHIDEFCNSSYSEIYPNRRLVQGMFEILLIKLKRGIILFSE